MISIILYIGREYVNGDALIFKKIKTSFCPIFIFKTLKSKERDAKIPVINPIKVIVSNFVCIWISFGVSWLFSWMGLAGQVEKKP